MLKIHGKREHLLWLCRFFWGLRSIQVVFKKCSSFPSTSTVRYRRLTLSKTIVVNEQYVNFSITHLFLLFVYRLLPSSRKIFSLAIASTKKLKRNAIYAIGAAVEKPTNKNVSMEKKPSMNEKKNSTQQEIWRKNKNAMECEQWSNTIIIIIITIQ